MRQLYSNLKARLLGKYSRCNRSCYYMFLLCFVLIIFPTIIFAEGSKEIYVNTDAQGLLLCNNSATHCNSGNGDRSQFATYNSDSLDRLNFVVNSSNETVYLGFRGMNVSTYSWHIVYRIRDEQGNVVKAESSLPTSGVGFINTIDEARQGPSALAGAGGYSEIEWTPPGIGTYHIEFNRVPNSGSGTSTGTFRIELFDITVANTITNTAELGRLYSHAWQFGGSPASSYPPSSAKFYIYSTDSVTTSLQLNEMDGQWWFLFCNQTGCGSTGNPTIDRRSVNYQVSLPEYRIFLNTPDIILFPPATTLGSIINLPVMGTGNCDSGTIDFEVEVDKAGYVEIELDFDPPYITRTIAITVTAGINNIIWDGLDGTTPIGVPVPNGTSISFTISYINGLTNLPLYDVEQNTNGFVIELVSPAGAAPLVYWDDSNLTPGTSNLTGCASTVSPWSGCHIWSDPPGDESTINTWWYTVSQVTNPVVITEMRVPDIPVFNQTPQNYCEGSQSILISVVPDPNTDNYNWGYTGSGVTINQNNPSDNFITIDLGLNATTGNIFVYGNNGNCGDGDTAFLFIGIQELPLVDAGDDESICSNGTIALVGSRINSNSSFWTTAGDGSFDNFTSLTPTYTPGPTDILNESVILSLTAQSISPCTSSVTDNMMLTLLHLPVANAGSDDNTCINGNYTLNGSSNYSSSSSWLSSGDGTFDDVTSLTATYTPGVVDKNNGFVILSLFSNAILPCVSIDQDDMTLTFDSLPVSNAGLDEIICIDQSVSLSGTIQNSFSSLWSTLGDGVFDDPSSLFAVYTPGGTDIANGTVDLLLTAHPIAPCFTDSVDIMTLSFDPLPIANAGIDDIICGNGSITLTGTRVNSNSSLWTTVGDGSFDDPLLEITTYTPGPNDILNGSVILTFTAYAELPCTTPDQDDMILTFYPLPEVNAGDDDNVCINRDYTLSGNAIQSDSIRWSTGGDGIFNDATLPNAIYTPGVSDKMNGFVVLTITAYASQPCTDTNQDDMTLTLDQPAIANAGVDDTICINSTVILFGNTTYSNSVLWSTVGDGSFADELSISTEYIPGPNDKLAGSVNLSLTAFSILPCTGDSTDVMTLTFDSLPQPHIDILPNDTLCINELVNFIGSDASGANIIEWEWNFGDGNSDVGQNPTHIYSTVLEDSVRLIATKDNTCVDTIYRNIWVLNPAIGLNISPKPACLGDTITFSGTGDIVDYTDWYWTFGDGSTHIGRDTSHFYNTSDTFKISLSVCSITIVDSAFVYQPAISDAGSNESICENTPFDFSTSNVLPSVFNYDSLLWFGGNGTFSNPKSLLPIYTPVVGEEGPVELFLTAYGILPCSNHTTSMILTLDSLPEPVFSFNPNDSICIDEIINFNGFNNNATLITHWEWDFGDGNQSIIQNPTHDYGLNGFYNVQLKIINSNGCTDSVSSILEVHPFPQPDFLILPNDTICAELPLSLNGFDVTGTNITNWYWDFGDGNQSTGQNVNHTYNLSGNYDITLSVLNDNTCSQIHVKQVNIQALPESDFTISPNDTTCVNELIYLDASNITSDITDWEWQFGDGNFTIGQNVSHTYTNPNSQAYNIFSIYQNSNGCIDTTIHQRYVQDVNIGFNMILSPTCQNFNVDFIGTGDRVAFTPWNWTFGDGSAGNTGIDVSHTYTLPDTVDVILDVCSEQDIQQLIINATCEVDAGSNQITCQDVYFDLTESATPPTADNFSSIQWTALNGLGVFNDPTLLAPTYFPHPIEGSLVNDTIDMMMVGYGIAPCENDTSYIELVVIPGAYAQAGSDENTCFGVPYDFANSTDSSFATNYATLYWLTSGTGTFLNGNTIKPTYVPGANEIGPITLTMVASNIINCDSIDDMVLTIRPIYEIPIDIIICYYDSIFAQGEWRYGSGTFYDTLPTFNYGCDSVIVTNLTVRPKIDQEFTLSTSDSICFGETADFVSSGTADLISWYWDFGDGNTSNLMYPSHQYNVPGNYMVIYYYTDDNGCSDSLVRQITVFELPDVTFTINMTNACVNTQVGFSGLSNSNIVSWDWDFGDGQIGSGQNITHIYSTWGDVTVTLTVTDINGCSETTYNIFKVVQPPEANFTYEIVICDSLQFFDLSIAPPGYNVVTWNWNFDDGDTSDLQNPTHQFPSNTTPGGEVYNVTLTVVSDSLGFICSDSIILPVNVPSLPDIFVTWTEPTCHNDTTYFYGESGFPVNYWHWDFGDGNFSNDEYPYHIYSSTGTYSVTLTIIDTLGCINSLTNLVNVYPVPTVSFSMSDTTACHGSEIQFTSTNSTNVETWYWDFGDGSFSPEDDPIHYFPQGGTYTVTLTVTDSAGCEAEASNHVLILPGATADFTYQNLTCSSVLFQDLSIAPPGYFITNWLWDFGDGFTANVQNPSHSYVTGIGVYDVTLIVTADSSGYSCNDTIVQTIYTPGLPTVFFTWTPEPTMLGNQTDFFGTSGNQITDWYWDFDDGNFATTQDATNTFATVGTFDVELTVTDIDGCQNTILHTVSVTNVPELDYSWNYSCMGEPIQFTVESPPTDIPAVVSWDWDFGDGGISTEMNPLHVYPVAGTYNVSLTIVDTMAATNTIIKQIVVNPLPVALFSIDPLTCAMNDVQFHDLSTTPTGFITQWHWEFGDGNTQTVNFPNDPDVIYQYAAIGTYTVSLTITNSDSCENTTTNDITITASPTAMFTHSEGCESNPFTFTDTSIENGGGIILQWNWDFGDPASGTDNTSTLQNPVHMFSAAGSYDVELMIMNSNGCTDTTTMTVTVEEDPEVEFSWTANCQGEETLFEVDETITNVTEVETFAWTFGDGGTSNLQNPTHIYTVAGDYTVTLMITTTAQCMASVTHTVPINPLPTANFDHDAPACLNQEVEFTDLSSSQNGLIETWEWDFGDGNITTITAPDNPDVTHLYGSDGNYDVMLTVTDGEGCINEVTKNVEVVSNPIADFNYDETCYNEPVYFTDMSTENGGPDIQSWEWFFGDPASGTNNNSNLQNPTHVFTAPGVYTTTLIIISTMGCSDTTEQDITVDELPLASIGVLDDSICLGQLAEFTGTGTNISTWYWEFGDGGTSIDQNPSYMYQSPGEYIVTLTVTGIGTEQCTFTTDTTITVNGAPEAMFEYENTCLGDSTYFTDLSYSQYGFVSQWDWDFGDGNTSTMEDPSHYYQNNDDYEVTLIVTDNYGCSDTIALWVQVYDSPNPSFTWDQVCDPVGQVNYFDESTPGTDGAPIVGWSWELDDGYFSSEIDPSYIYNIIDTCYTVLLTVTDNNGCESTDTNTQVCLHGELEIDFTTTTVCQNQETTFTAIYGPQSDSVASYTWNFNDGSPIEITYYDTIAHIFPQPGMYIVELTAVDTNDCMATIYKEVTVDSLPTAQFTNTIGNCATATEFTDISLGGGEFIENWLWNFGDIASPDNTSTLQNPTHLYGPNDSIYHVKLIVTNFNGCIDSIEQDVYVEPCVVANFELPIGNNCARTELCFTDTSNITSNNNAIDQWRWEFGDGETYNYGDHQNPICHTYEDAGDYDVQLIVVATINGTTYQDTMVHTLTVNPTPLAEIGVTNNCLNDTTRFYDNSTTFGAPILTYEWTFGDETTANDTSSMQDPKYKYPSYGDYITQLIVDNEYGCIDTITDTITVFKLPEAKFSFEELCMSYYTYFTDESIGDSSDIANYYWIFDINQHDTNTSIEPSPVNIYDTAGIYYPRLIVMDENMCKDSIDKVVDIKPIPTSNFMIIDTIQQGNIYLQNLSQDVTGLQDGLTYYWDFDYDYGQSSTEVSPTHQYEVDGNYDVMLVSYNEFNCPDTMHQIYNLLFTNLFVPNAFSPSSALTDLQIFKPTGINIKSYRLEVYSAWGNLVFESTKLDNGAPMEGWDGTYKNKDLPTGSYIWRISAVFEDGEHWKGTDNGDGNSATNGTITLIR